MRVLIVSPVGILPANEGNKARISRVIDLLEARGHEVWFAALGLQTHEISAMRERFGERLAYVTKLRIRQLRPIHRAMWRWFTEQFVMRGVYCPSVDYWFLKEWDELLRDLSRRARFDVVCSEYIFLTRAFRHFAETRKIVDTHDLFANRYARLKKAGIRDSWFFANEATEAEGLSRADLVMAIQDNEARHFRRLTKGEVEVITAGHPVECVQLRGPGKFRAGYIASGNHPNQHAIRWFLDHVWPAVLERMPEATLRLAGSICSKIEKRPSVEMISRVENLADFYGGVDVLINPMQFGTGLKIKTMEALGYGKPLVTTSVGAEGIETNGASCFVVADAPRDFAASLVHLLRDTTFAKEMGEAARRFILDYNSAQESAIIEAFEGTRGGVVNQTRAEAYA